MMFLRTVITLYPFCWSMIFSETGCHFSGSCSVETVEFVGDKDHHRAACPFGFFERNGDALRIVVALDHVKRQIERHQESLGVGRRAVLVDTVTRVATVTDQEDDRSLEIE